MTVPVDEEALELQPDLQPRARRLHAALFEHVAVEAGRLQARVGQVDQRVGRRVALRGQGL